MRHVGFFRRESVVLQVSKNNNISTFAKVQSKSLIFLVLLELSFLLKLKNKNIFISPSGSTSTHTCDALQKLLIEHITRLSFNVKDCVIWLKGEILVNIKVLLNLVCLLSLLQFVS